MDDETQDIIEQHNERYRTIASEWCGYGGFLMGDATQTQPELIEDAEAARG